MEAEVRLSIDIINSTTGVRILLSALLTTSCMLNNQHAYISREIVKNNASYPLFF